MPFIGNQPALSYTSFAVQHFTTSATTSYTLDYSVANENEIRLVINNVVQQPGSSYAYTASGTTLTLSAATSATDTMYAVFLGKAVQTVTPASGSVTNAMLSSGSFSNITGTGTLTNFASTGIDDNATANALTIDSSSNLQFNSGFGSVVTAYGCRAWVNFNGTGTVAIRGSGNVSSITDNGTGDYTVNFTTAMPDTNYSISTCPVRYGTETKIREVTLNDDITSTSSVSIYSAYEASTDTFVTSNENFIFLQVFR